MAGAGDILVVFSTFPDVATAETVVRQVVALRLAACGNILPPIRSTYWWEGEVQAADEVLAVFKLPSAKYAQLESKLRELHPYDVPEIVALPVAQGLPDYLQWVANSCL
jgi:periplasmic divalent cation tolerance protein